MNGAEDALSVDAASAVLSRNALVGTNVASDEVRTGAPQVDALLASRDGEDDSRERSLLRAAGVLAFVKRTARRPPVFAIPEDAAADDELERAGPGAALALRTLLETRGGEGVVEWLELAHRFERRVPEQLLPAVLSHAESRSSLHALVRSTIGERGRWLASQRDAWTWAVHPDDPVVTFERGKRTERVRALETLRERDPAAARERLALELEKESAGERAALLDALAVGISSDDEPFLEAQLVDKSAEVRAHALALAQRLPGARAVARVVRLADPLLRIERVLLRKTLVVELPEAFTPEMREAGILEKRQRLDVGERAWWFEQILGRVPLSHWCERFGLSIAELVSKTEGNDFATSLVAGFTASIDRFGDTRAASELLARAPTGAYAAHVASSVDPALVPNDDRERAIGAFLRDGQPSIADVLIARTPRPWSFAFSQKVVAYLIERSNGGGDALDVAARRVAPEIGGAPLARPVDAAGHARFERFASAIAFRHAMHDHLKAGT